MIILKTPMGRFRLIMIKITKKNYIFMKKIKNVLVKIRKD